MPEKLWDPLSAFSEASTSNLGNWPVPWLANFPPSFVSKLPGLAPPEVSILKSRSKVPLWMLVGLLKVCWRTCCGSSLLPPPPQAAKTSAATSANASAIRGRIRVTFPLSSGAAGYRKALSATLSGLVLS